MAGRLRPAFAARNRRNRPEKSPDFRLLKLGNLGDFGPESPDFKNRPRNRQSEADSEGRKVQTKVQTVPEWRGPESNRRHCDFQSHALPTELPRQGQKPRHQGEPQRFAILAQTSASTSAGPREPRMISFPWSSLGPAPEWHWSPALPHASVFRGIEAMRIPSESNASLSSPPVRGNSSPGLLPSAQDSWRRF